MNWKKNVFSYILWVVYTAAVSVGVLGLSASVCYRIGYPMEYGIAITIGYLVIVGLLVLGVRKLWRRYGIPFDFEGNMAVRVAEGLFVVLLLFLGIYLRTNLVLLTSGSVDGMIYYEAAVVTAGKGVPQVVHGATYLYLGLLHLIFIFMGNKLAAAVMLQIVLQILVAIVLYMAVRKLAGTLAGIFTTAFLMISPYMVGSVLELSPAFLYLLLYMIALLGVGAILQKNSGNPLWYVVAGIFVGIVSYLDIFGITLFLFLGAVFMVERDYQESMCNSRLATFLFGVLGVVAGFLGAIGVDTISCGKSFFGVLTAWMEIYQPVALGLAASTEASGAYGDVAILFGVLAIGIFSFWCRKRYERQGIWIAVTTALMGLQCFQMMVQNAGSQIYIYIFMAILAGIGLEAVFVVDRPRVSAETVTNALQQEEQEDDMEIIHEGTAEVREEVPEEVSVETPAETRKVQLLENPLPLPKKHVSKEMSYRISEVKEDSNYDYDVADDDDYDIR